MGTEDNRIIGEHKSLTRWQVRKVILDGIFIQPLKSDFAAWGELNKNSINIISKTY